MVTSIVVPEKDGWTELAYQMPYFALLRHLNTLNRNGVFDNPEVVNYVYNKLTNIEAIKNSKILPFRFFEAWKVGEYLPNKIRNALEIALEKSFVNIPKLPDDVKIIVGTDVSGSMTSFVNKRSVYTFADIAAVLSIAIYKQNPKNTIIIPFDDKPYTFIPDEFKTMMEMINWFSKIMGGGTDLGVPVREALEHNYEADIFIGVTDNEDWAGHGVMNDLAEYREKVNPDLYAYLIRIDPYVRDTAINIKDPKNKLIYGWSDQVLKFIALTYNGEAQLDYINKYLKI